LRRYSEPFPEGTRAGVGTYEEGRGFLFQPQLAWSFGFMAGRHPAYATALANQKQGFTNLLALHTPNLPCKPATVLITKVTIEGMHQVAQMFGPAQAAVAKAVGALRGQRPLERGAFVPAVGASVAIHSSGRQMTG